MQGTQSHFYTQTNTLHLFFAKDLLNRYAIFLNFVLIGSRHTYSQIYLSIYYICMYVYYIYGRLKI